MVTFIPNRIISNFKKRQQAASVIFTEPFGVLGEFVLISAVDEVTEEACYGCCPLHALHW